jgi:hypothetical protein
VRSQAAPAAFTEADWDGLAALIAANSSQELKPGDRVQNDNLPPPGVSVVNIAFAPNDDDAEEWFTGRPERLDDSSVADDDFALLEGKLVDSAL